MSLYTELRDAGCTLDSHESDLYVRDCTQARAILKANGCIGSIFRSEVDNQLWLDVPFMFEPFWDAKTRQA